MQSFITHHRAALALSVLLFAAGSMAAQSASQNTTYNTTRGVALNGYDVVAYFTEGRPLKGSAAFSHTWDQTTWRFASAAHRDAFVASPETYAPQFGGFCAYGVSQGYAVDIDPHAWTMVDGRLYLNYSKRVQRMWDRDRAAHIRNGEANWPAIAAKHAGKE